MKQYKFVYWNNGDVRKTVIEAESKEAATIRFHMTIAHDDIISVEEVTESVS